MNNISENFWIILYHKRNFSKVIGQYVYRYFTDLFNTPMLKEIIRQITLCTYGTEGSMNNFIRIYHALINKNSNNLYVMSWSKWKYFPNIFNTNTLKDLFYDK